MSGIGRASTKYLSVYLKKTNTRANKHYAVSLWKPVV
ncbi:hypothetical protein CLOBOL_06899 [Enterocloster bolteae ATCC BAA-613]|uniref:Uncharacterized protein n=1 Tax=Enterocloster bolteae (strain ATCC BAA-613 / DSM 15670 / CCUG 46953 / JCM 12243 / WAL 16351) TaxID=411902 RepID=A8S4W7_ENTBW|nr:hypothetical protein CLOBOL_06899 [Enterocloster bolteae ATCC BAA-613]